MFSSASNGKVAASSPSGRSERQGRRSGTPLRVIRGAIGSFTLAAALMAVMNIENIWQSYEWQSRPRITSVARQSRLVSRIVSKKGSNITAELKGSFKNDELNSINPYASMMTSDPIDAISKRGVVHYTREALRSPAYDGEMGYDMVYYNVEQADQSHSTVLAYLEDGKTPFVIVHHQEKDQPAEYYFFRDGMLVPQAELNSKEVEALIAQRVSSGIPFLTVSR